MSKKYTLTHYMAESTSRQDEANPVLIGLIDLACSVKKTGSIFYIISELKQQNKTAIKKTTNLV